MTRMRCPASGKSVRIFTAGKMVKQTSLDSDGSGSSPTGGGESPFSVSESKSFKTDSVLSG